MSNGKYAWLINPPGAPAQSKYQRIYAAHPELNARLLEVLPLGRHTVPLMEVEGGLEGSIYVDPVTKRKYEIVWIRCYLLDVYVWLDDAPVRMGSTTGRLVEVQTSIQIIDSALQLINTVTHARIHSMLMQDATGLHWRHPGDDQDLRMQARACD